MFQFLSGFLSGILVSIPKGIPNFFASDSTEPDPEPTLAPNEFHGIDIDGQSYRLPLPLFPSPPQFILTFGNFQPGMPYGRQDQKNKWMRLEGEEGAVEGRAVISGWVPDSFLIQTIDGEQYSFGWVNRANPITNPTTFRPIYRLREQEKKPEPLKTPEQPKEEASDEIVEEESTLSESSSASTCDEDCECRKESSSSSGESSSDEQPPNPAV